MCPGPAALRPDLLGSRLREQGLPGQRVSSFRPEFVTQSPCKAPDPVVSTGTCRTREGGSPSQAPLPGQLSPIHRLVWPQGSCHSLCSWPPWLSPTSRISLGKGEAKAAGPPLMPAPFSEPSCLPGGGCVQHPEAWTEAPCSSSGGPPPPLSS